jgi:hypothetical protein
MRQKKILMNSLLRRELDIGNWLDADLAYLQFVALRKTKAKMKFHFEYSGQDENDNFYRQIVTYKANSLEKAWEIAKKTIYKTDQQIRYIDLPDNII